MADIFYEYLLQ